MERHSGQSPLTQIHRDWKQAIVTPSPSRHQPSTRLELHGLLLSRLAQGKKYSWILSQPSAPFVLWIASPPSSSCCSPSLSCITSFSYSLRSIPPMLFQICFRSSRLKKQSTKKNDKYNRNLLTSILPPPSVPSLLPFTGKLLEQVTSLHYFQFLPPRQPDLPPHHSTGTTLASASNSLDGARFNVHFNVLPLFDPSAACASWPLSYSKILSSLGFCFLIYLRSLSSH